MTKLLTGKGEIGATNFEKNQAHIGRQFEKRETFVNDNTNLAVLCRFGNFESIKITTGRYLWKSSLAVAGVVRWMDQSVFLRRWMKAQSTGTGVDVTRSA